MPEQPTVAGEGTPLVRHVAAAAALEAVSGYLSVELDLSGGPPPGSRAWQAWYAARLRELASRVERS